MEEREMAWRGVREESKEGGMALTCNPCVMARQLKFVVASELMQ